MSVLNQGGPVFMYPLVCMLILILVLFVKELVKRVHLKTASNLISNISLFAIAWGFLAQIIGLMSALEAIQMASDISPTILAAGLRISFIAPVFGIIIFLIGRLGIIVLTWMQKE